MEDKQYSQELFFACILQGEEKHLKKIKKHLQKQVNKGVIKLINPVYDKNEIYILTGDQWKEYQKLLKNREEGLIGYPIE